MKTLIRLWLWIFTPALFALAIGTGNPQFAQVAAVFMWVVLGTLGPLGAIAMGATLLSKPGDENWETDKAQRLKNRSGVFAKFAAWVALILTVALAAYAGYVVTAGFFLLASLWLQFCDAVIGKHYETAQP